MIAALGFFAALVVGTIAGVPRVAHADHPTEVTPDLNVILQHAADRRGNIVRDDNPAAVLTARVVARNPIALSEPTGGKVKVCSVARYETPVKAAIAVWNAGAGVEILEWGGIERNDGRKMTATHCKLDDRDSRHELSSVIVQEFGDPASCVGGAACARALRLLADPWYGYLGRTIIAVNTSYWDDHFHDDVLRNIDKGHASSHERTRRDRMRVALFVHELGHALGFSHPYEAMFYEIEQTQHPVLGCPASFTVDGNPVEPIPGYTPPRLGFHYEESGSAREEVVLFSEGDSATLLAVDESVHGGTVMIGGAHCWGDTKITATNKQTWTYYHAPTLATYRYSETPGDWRYDSTVALRQYTKDGYTRVYNPASVTDVTVRYTGTGTDRDVEVKWTADHVHVEKGFVVQVRVNYPALGLTDQWRTVAKADPNAEQITFDPPTDIAGELTIVKPDGGGIATYRVFALTDAFGSDASGSKQPENDAPGPGVPGTPGPVVHSTSAVVVPPPPKPDPFTAPVITGFSADADEASLSATFTWTGSTSTAHFLQWELHRASTSDGSYAGIATKTDSSSSVTFTRRTPGWYKLRGQACIHQDDQSRASGRDGATGGAAQDNPLLTCGAWSSFSSPIQLKAPQQCTLTVTHDEGGTASQSAASVACGGSITATATANACYDFTGWTGDVTTTSRSVGITMDRSKSIHANFAHDGTKHTLTVRVHGGGTATGAGTHDCGTIVVAKATANLGWRFKTWEPDRFGTKTTTRVLMARSGWIAAHFERDIVAWGSFTVTGTGSSQPAAAGDAAGRAATEAARLGADRHWRTAISYQTTTSTMVTYRSTVTASWSRTGTTTGEAYGTLPNSKGEASSVGLQVAVAAAKSRAYRGIPSDATFRGYLSTVSSGYNADAKLGPVGHWALAWARWVRTGTVTGSGSGETKAAAESAALGDARSKAAGSLSSISYSTSKITETVVTVTVTATADYTWVQYRGQEAAAQSGVGVGTDDESAIPAHEPEPE